MGWPLCWVMHLSENLLCIPLRNVELKRSGAWQNSSIFSAFKTGLPFKAVAAAFTTSENVEY